MSEEQAAVSGGSKTGRPPLTERRKAATRLEIAREAVRLFTTQGVAGTSAEEIAEAAGVSVRTLWRYFPTKESCVRPILTVGADLTVRSLRAWSRDRPLTEVVRELGEPQPQADAAGMLALIRLTRTEPGLRAVWLQAHDDAEPLFARLIADRSGLPADDLRVKVQAAMLNGSLRTAVEYFAQHSHGRADKDGLLETIATALTTVSRGLPD